MRWGGILVVVAVVSCKGRADAPTPAPAPAPKPVSPAVDPLALSPGSPPLLALPPAELPAPAAGYFRFPYYDLDVKLRDVAHAELHGRNAVTFDHGCTLVVDAYHDAPLRIGTLEVQCQAAGRDRDDRVRSDCEPSCKTLVAVPGSTAVEPYPPGPPVLELHSRPTNGDRISRGAYVWSDGTVQFFGPTCARWRGRRGTLAPERVKEIVAALERTGVLGTLPSRSCDEGTYAKIVVRAHGEDIPPYSFACTPDGSPMPREITSVAAALGPNPCDIAPPPRPPLPKAPPAALVSESAPAAPFPKEAPAIAFKYVAGGMSGPIDHGLEVWLDGTVRFAGYTCKAPRRATLPPDRVAALLAALDQRATLDAGITMDSMTACCDCSKSSLELRFGVKHARLIKPGCDNSATHGFADALALVTEVVGANPCVDFSPPTD